MSIGGLLKKEMFFLNELLGYLVIKKIHTESKINKKQSIMGITENTQSHWIQNVCVSHNSPEKSERNNVRNENFFT